MAEFPALPLFTDSIIADCNHLTDAEFGLYTRILMLMWRTPECRIPNDVDWISRKLGRQPSEFLPILKEFCYTDGNHYRQKRLYKEWCYLKKMSKKNSVVAKARWNKEKYTCQTDATWHQSGNAPTPNLSSKKEPIVSNVKRNITYSSDFENFWKLYPRKDCSKADAFKAYEKALATTPADTIIAGVHGLKKAIEIEKTENKYIPHAATWINGRRWEAEYVPTTIVNGSGPELTPEYVEKMKIFYKKIGIFHEKFNPM